MSRRPATDDLHVSCIAQDLRYIATPILVGHYQDDPISGAEALIDRELVDGALTVRKHLGLYAGPVGTATIVLSPPNPQERLRGQQRGAVVVGLGAYGSLTAGNLMEAVRAGGLRLLLRYLELDEAVPDPVTSTSPPLADPGAGHRRAARLTDDLTLSTLLLGYNSTTNLSVEDSVNAIVRGVIEANRHFAKTMRLPLRIKRLQLVECYLDAAISATRALRRIATRINAERMRQMAEHPHLLTDDPSAAADLIPTVIANDELRRGPGIRQRLELLGATSYWPRMIITDPDLQDVSCTHASPKPSGKLRYIYLSQRARAETQIHQRQPDLVERLVRQATRRFNTQEDLSRTLFQLLLPADFKDASRQMEQLVLVLDPVTAALPWEMLQADNEPMAAKTAVVRQLATQTYRPQVRSTVGKQACVIGDPPTQGFGTVFGSVMGPHGSTGPGLPDPPPLAGAAAEAQAIARVLTEYGYEVDCRVQDEAPALDVLNTLYRQPYRILHIAAHGVCEALGRDGVRRTGIVLSDGMLLGAAEIKSMELVPDLVFLNCCHIGQINPSALKEAPKDSPSPPPHAPLEPLADLLVPQQALAAAGSATTADGDGDSADRSDRLQSGLQPDGVPADPAVQTAAPTLPRLAYSLARELIEMGVRAVVAAGWAVQDQAASHFAEAFYKYLIAERLPFGDAVFAARREVWLEFPGCNTWGAYQAWGDPSLLIDPQAPAGFLSNAESRWRPVAHEELLERLERERTNATRSGQALTRLETDAARRRIKALLAAAPAPWQAMPVIQHALARLFADIGRHGFDDARRHYLEAIRLAQVGGDLPARTFEQLANLEARRGEQTNSLDLVQAALGRLLRLAALYSGHQPQGVSVEAQLDQLADQLDALQRDDPNAVDHPYPSAEVCSLIGSACKRHAAVLARRVNGLSPPEPQALQHRADLVAALKRAIRWYLIGERVVTQGADPSQKIYRALNRLSLQAILGDGCDDLPQKGHPGGLATMAAPGSSIHTALRQADDCLQAALQTYREAPDSWDAIGIADAQMTVALFDGRLLDPLEHGYRDIERNYLETLSRLRLRSRDVDSVQSHLRILGECMLALTVGDDAPCAGLTRDHDERVRLAQRLRQLAVRIQQACRPNRPRGGSEAVEA